MRRLPVILSCGVVVACVPPPPSPDESMCNHTLLEPDFRADQELRGPGIDADGKVPEGRYVLSSTYLAIQLSTDAFSTFSEVNRPIREALQSQPGLVGYQTGFSPDCYAARTLAVWSDEESMLQFVVGSAHGAAMAAIDEISRGKSIVTHWEDDATGSSWQRAVEMISADEGPFY